MAQAYKFAVTATAPSGARTVVSRHATLPATMKALKLAHGNQDYKIISLEGERCKDCGINYADSPSHLCAGCEAYMAHHT